jgi:hypothetical protein
MNQVVPEKSQRANYVGFPSAASTDQNCCLLQFQIQAANAFEITDDELFDHIVYRRDFRPFLYFPLSVSRD